MTHYLAKPTPGPLNKEHQLSKGLVFFMPLLDQVQAVDVVTGERGTTGESAGGSLRFERWGYGPHINVIPDANVSFPNSTGKLGGLSALTFAGWANIRNTGNFGRLFISNSLTVLCDPNSIGNVLGIVVNGGAGPVDSSQVIPFTANEWFHFAFVWNGSTMTMYKNGLKVNEYSHASGITTASDTNPIYIGDTATFDRWFDGRVDGLAVWNRALTQDEVSSLYRDQWQMLRPSQAIRPTIYSLVPPDPGTTAVADLDAKPKPSSPVIQHDHPLAKGLVAEWLFAEKDGTTSRETVRGANVALSGSTFSQVKGPSGYAVNFMGGMGAADSPLSGATEATIHTRLKTLGVGSSGFDPWICSQTAYNGGFYLGHDAGPATQVFISGTKVSGPSIDDGEWHDYVVTYRGGIDLKIFVDGVLRVSSAMAVTSIPAHTGVWFAANPPASFTLQCTIDHARIWNRALSQDEVSSLSVDPFAVDRPRSPLAAILASLATSSGSQTVTPSSITEAISTGSPTLSVGPVTIAPDTIAQAVSLGTPTVSTGTTVAPNTITEAVTLGSPAVTPGAVTIAPDGITQGVALGSPTVSLGAATIAPTAITEAVSMGSPALSVGAVTIAPTSITQSVLLGSPTVSTGTTVIPTTITETINLGNPTLTVGTVTITPGTIHRAVLLGNPTVGVGAVTIVPVGIAQAVLLGSPRLSTGAVIITPSGIAQVVLLGSPTVTRSATRHFKTVLAPYSVSTRLGADRLSAAVTRSGIDSAQVTRTGVDSSQVTPL